MLRNPLLLRSAAPFTSRYFTSSALMPLRAKILGAQRGMSTESPRPVPGDEPEDVLFNSSYGVRTIELNRPKKLNVLNGSMIRKIVPRLLEWAKSDMANVIIMKGAGEKSLCAGGDVAILAQWNQEGPAGQQRSKEYFAEEYKLDHLIATYSKPYVAFMDGITMGGGVGLSAHAPFRIATERTVLSMPETTIGFFPDVGASFFLSRLDGALGAYLALTSERLKGVEAFYQGIASHYIHSSSLPDLEQRLGELTFRDFTTYQQRLETINNTIAEFVTGLPHDQPMLLTGELRKTIDRIFSADDVDQITSSLSVEAEKEGDIAKWAQKTLATIRERSPTSVKVALRQIQLGRSWNIDVAFQREYELACKFMEHPDFVEGVSALLIKKVKGRPSWQPEHLESVDSNDIDAFFRTPSDSERLKLLSNGPTTGYAHYPHHRFSLPSEAEVKNAVDGFDLSAQEIIDLSVHDRRGKIGVQEKVREILERKTTTKKGIVHWIA